MTQCPVISWQPLGELLVERGALTTMQLEEALEEQGRTGERLGAILVARKIVPSALLTMLLAEQAGVELETQNGFGSGLFSKIAGRNGVVGGAPTPRSPAPEPSSFEASFEVQAPPADLAFELSALRAELESLRARNAQLEQELAAKPKPRRRTAAKRA